jgi:hypothetical protein
MSHAIKKKQAAPKLTVAGGERVRGHRAGTIVGLGERGLLVDYPGNTLGVLPARSIVAIDAQLAAAAHGSPLSALLVFEDERADRPIVVGLLQSAPAKAPAKPVEAMVDGKRVVLDAQDEIVLRCGEASITLRRNGRVVIRGAYVETHAKGTNRIKGGSVQIN